MARILVVDDDDGVRSVFTRVLQDAGHDVATASDGLEAEEVFRAEPAELVVLDIIMPQQEGLETIVSLRRDFPDVKIIAVSGGGQFRAEDCLVTARKLGANTTLQKPVHPDRLVEAVAALTA